MEEQEAKPQAGAKVSGLWQFAGVALAMGALVAVAALSEHGAAALEPLAGGYEPPLEARQARVAEPAAAPAPAPASATFAAAPARP